ncbi:cryptochrome/photolyase family protein [Seonamhaeicola aphaedonensis]|uniref:Deoxyribodipyrimidine photo-lyase n=1 Tax=Seonamhaeicola aphaedonensis TaxID=1461338 RepID=A0A3D9HFI4_9FLAO|nr:deoxyribodipyrimidine photo-lyase [Seonamhaeicola aphaedonensis]RED48252.1 deoxyribodipyrimidine photo-lyase [Seonamhaeicola aphaedonensis]
MKQPINIFWFRRDLRLYDNNGFSKALKSNYKVLPIFIFDSNILDKLPKDDARVTFIYNTLQTMRESLQKNNKSDIALFYGTPLEVFKILIKTYNIHTVYTNHDHEPYGKERDRSIEHFLKKEKIAFRTYKDHVIFERSEIVKNNGEPYMVYTPYMKAWKQKFTIEHLDKYKTEENFNNLYSSKQTKDLELVDIGFKKSGQYIKAYNIDSELIETYEAKRNFPAEDATSRLGPHLRFGTVSIREIVKKSLSQENPTFLNELIWREFFMQILWHFPYTVDYCFKTKYERLEWRNNETDFKAWCFGQTGYPLVDAGMRQLNKTGFMHNRVRMLVGSFLCKHLLIDWRWGEAYFAEKLHDYELSSNVGNWQWVAGCGVDAAPYFRIFNPITQVKKFDKNLEYINKWVPEFQELTYPKPIVEHKFARERCLEFYKKALN